MSKSLTWTLSKPPAEFHWNIEIPKCPIQKHDTRVSLQMVLVTPPPLLPCHRHNKDGNKNWFKPRVRAWALLIWPDPPSLSPAALWGGNFGGFGNLILGFLHSQTHAFLLPFKSPPLPPSSSLSRPLVGWTGAYEAKKCSQRVTMTMIMDKDFDWERRRRPRSKGFEAKVDFRPKISLGNFPLWSILKSEQTNF